MSFLYLFSVSCNFYFYFIFCLFVCFFITTGLPIRFFSYCSWRYTWFAIVSDTVAVSYNYDILQDFQFCYNNICGQLERECILICRSNKFSHGHYLHTTETVRSNVNFSSLLVLPLSVNGQVLKPGSYNVNGNINVLADGSITTNVQMRPGKGGSSLATQSSADSEGNIKRINLIITEFAVP